jgi:uncharacterized OsmC-like protein
MISKIIYKGNLRTEAIHLKSGEKIITDAPIDNNGKGEAFSPTDLTATSLGNCMVTIMGIAAQNHNLNIDGTALEVTKIMSADPRRISGISIKVIMPEVEYTTKDKKLLETAGRSCPVAMSLHPDLVQDIEFIWH